MQLFLFILTGAFQVSLRWKKYWNLVAATEIIKHLRLTTELISPLWLLRCPLVVHSKLSVKAASLCWTKPQRNNMKTNRNFMEYCAGLNGTSCSFRAISRDPSWSLAVRSPAPPRPCQGCPGDQIWLCGCSVLSLACKVADVEARRQFLSWRIPLQQAAEWPRCFFSFQSCVLLVLHGLLGSQNHTITENMVKHTFTITFFSLLVKRIVYRFIIPHLSFECIFCSNLANSWVCLYSISMITITKLVGNLFVSYLWPP